jgi:carbon storage regulator
MLILTRRMGESIRIGDDITVLITGVDQNKVKIGITSPRHIPIYREELYLKIQQENKEAAGIEQGDLDEMLELVTE